MREQPREERGGGGTSHGKHKSRISVRIQPSLCLFVPPSLCFEAIKTLKLRPFKADLLSVCQVRHHTGLYKCGRESLLWGSSIVEKSDRRGTASNWQNRCHLLIKPKNLRFVNYANGCLKHLWDMQRAWPSIFIRRLESRRGKKLAKILTKGHCRK